KLADKNVLVNSVHPGAVETELGRNLAEPRSGMYELIMSNIRISAAKGAITQIYVAASDDIAHKKVNGKYFVPYAVEAPTTALAQDAKELEAVWNWTEKVLQE
ncbi:hypothetical protein HDU76_012249, partial [Blyttiomyces sp. JEL0837]